MASAGSRPRKEDDEKKKKNKALKQVDMAAPPQDGRKQNKNKKSKAREEAEIAASQQEDGKQKKIKRKSAPQHQPLHGAHGEEDGGSRSRKQKPPRDQAAAEADGFQQNRKKDKEKLKKKQLGKHRDLPEEDEEKRKSKKQKLRRQDQPDENKKRNRWEREEGGEGNKKPTGSGGRESLIMDARFSTAHSDPRFQRLPTRQSKVTIDSRCSRMFSEKGFASSSATVDKRGRPRKEKADNPLLHYYHREEEEEDAPAVEKEDEEEGDRASASEVEREPSSSEEDSEGYEDDSDVSSSSGEDEDEEDSESADDSNAYQFWMANQEDTPTTENETRRVAVVNLDWDHIKAVDLYVLMSTCLLTSCPQSGGQILSVAVYPSDFGLKCMDIEAVCGPHALFDGGGSDDADADGETVNERIRSYQLKRLKYYYAVVECDSSATANHLYNSLDGVEFLRTANVLDLRFIPDSMEFRHPPRDIATEVPPDYKQPDFETSALQHSTVKLTWDDDEPDRKKTLRRKFNPEKMDELEQYLASDDSDDDDSDENGEGHGEKYSALLQSADTSGTEEDNDSGQEMEVTFLPGVENLSKHIDKNRLKKSEEGVWDAYLRKRREKLKARKKSRKLSSDDESNDSSEYSEALHQPDDFFVEEPSDSDAKDDREGSKKDSRKAATKNSHKDRRHSQEKEREEETREATTAELELLLAEDDANNEHLKGFNLRPKKGKGKKGKEVPVEDKLPDVDASSDARFSSRLISHLYALDPTDPQYKRSMSGMKQAHAQKQRKGNVRNREPEENVYHPPDDEKPLKENHNIMSLVRCLKLKSKALADGGKGGA